MVILDNVWYLDDDHEESLKEFEESESSSTRDSGFDDLEEKSVEYFILITNQLLINT